MLFPLPILSLKSTAESVHKFKILDHNTPDPPKPCFKPQTSKTTKICHLG